MSILQSIERGMFIVINVDGTNAHYNENPTLDSVHKAMGCDCFDAISLKDDLVMLVDDEGIINKKPVNPAATKLLRDLYGMDFYPVHGNVAIVNDLDFKED